MASLRKQKKTWFACFTLADGKRTQRSTGIKDLGTPQIRADNMRLALVVAQEYEEAARGNRTEAQLRKSMGDLFNRVNGKRIEFAKTDLFLREWLVQVKVRKSEGTLTRYEKIVDDFLQHLGEKAAKPISEVGIDDVQTYLDEQMKDGKRAKTARNEAKILNIPFARAHRQGLILTNPVAGADLPDDDGESKSPFTQKQVSAIILEAVGDWKTVVLFGAYLGARLTDCANFTWTNVSLNDRLIRYRPKKTKRHKKEVVCPLHPALEKHLRSIQSSQKTSEAISPGLVGLYTGGRSGLSNKFEQLIERAGIKNDPISNGRGKGRAFREYGFHSFRHTFKSILVNAGVEVETVDVLIGHAKKTVSETYIHRSTDLLRKAIEKLPTF